MDELINIKQNEMENLTVREYLGNKIEFKTIEGYVYANANQMANGFGGSQKLADWKRSENTKKYIEALNKNKLWKNSIISEEGRKGGTWIHEKLILNFARYLNVEFELWCDEQIATLLREGSVALNKKDSLLLNIIKANSDSQRAIALNTYEMEYVKPLENTIKEQQPKIEYHDTVLYSDKLVTITSIAKDLGMSAVKLNKILNELHIQYKKGRCWYLYAEYENLVPAYFDYHITEYGQMLKATELGRKWIINLLEEEGVI